MGNIFFISDLHFGHRAICKYRTEFKSPEEHDEYIIQQWNNTVKKSKNIVWVLGDFCMDNKQYDYKKIIDRLVGNINLITGNHCYLPAYNHNKIKVMNGVLKKYGFWLSHAPIHPDELRGHKNIHGHVHYKSINDIRYINVCCEVVGYKPLELEEIRRKP